MKKSKNPKELERNFYIDFPLCIPNSTLTLFPNDFIDVVKNVDFILNSKYKTKKIKQDNLDQVNVNLFNIKSDKFIQNIQANNLEFKDNDFESEIEKIALSKKKD